MPRTKPKPKANECSEVPAMQEVLTLAEAAAYLRVSEDDILRGVREQGLPGRQVAGAWRFLKEALQEWLRSPPAVPSKKEFWETHFGALKDDPYLEEMLKEIYAQRGRPETEAG
jgi:excisionase family DNA binding protein